jgi:3-hydroxyisobutyrate dehydrogenase
MTMKIALLGLGIMGTGMAGNWLKKGFALTVWNRTASRAAGLAEKGATVAATPRAAVADADVVVAMVAEDAASRDVWLGADGALAGMKPGAIAIESSTLTPDWIRELAAAAAAAGLRFLDSPVMGSRGAAADGKLTLFVGGEAETLAAARPALEAVGTIAAHLGPAGSGATWKLIGNMMGAVQVALIGEAVAMADAAGLDRDAVARLIANGGTGSPLVQMKMPRLLEHRYGDTDFALRLMLKDTRYGLALAEKLGTPLRLLPAASALYARADAEGHGEEDFAAVATVAGKA